MRRRDLVLVAVVVLAVPAPGLAQKVPLGPEFQVNTFTTGDQGAAIDHYDYYGQGQAVASDATGNFVVVWQSEDQDGGAFSGVFGQRYDSGGLPQGGEFPVNTFTTGTQTAPAVAADTAGNFVVVWQSQYADSGGYYPAHIRGQRYDSAGAPLGGEFQVDTPTSPVDYNFNPDVVRDPSGSFVVVWEHRIHSPTEPELRDIFGRRYDSAGAPVGGSFLVSTTPDYYNVFPAVAADADGNFVVVWQSFYTALGRRFDSNGTAQGGEFSVSPMPGYDVERLPDVAMAADGEFVVVWWGLYLDDGGGIGARRFDSTGAPLGGTFVVNSYDYAGQRRPGVAAASDGAFVVVWDSAAQYYAYDVFGQQFDSSGIPVGAEFRVSSGTAGARLSPRVAADAGGNFVVAWLDYYDRDGSGTGVFARRFGDAGPCSPTPQTLCREQTAPRGTFRFREAANPNQSTLAWLWTKGVETTREDLGDPLTDTDYALCVYDASANPQPIMSARAPAGGTCGTAAIPCWREIGGPGPPVEYYDSLATSDGLMRVRLKPGAEGKARVIVGGRGAALSLPELPLALPVTVQLQASTGECWTASYEAFVRMNADGTFRARPGTTTTTSVATTTTTSSTTTGPPTTTTTLPPVCGNLALESGEGCDDGNTVGGDGCSSTCQCNPATAPPACDLTGTWTVTEFPGSTLTVTEDAAGNSTTTGTVSGDPFATQATRSGSCGSGTVIDPVNGLPFRFTVNDACDRQFHVVHPGIWGSFTLVRVP